MPKRCLYRDWPLEPNIVPLWLFLIFIFLGSLQAECFCAHNIATFVVDKNNSSMQQLKWLLTYCQASVSGNRNMCIYKYISVRWHSNNKETKRHPLQNSRPVLCLHSSYHILVSAKYGVIDSFAENIKIRTCVERQHWAFVFFFTDNI